MSAAAPHQAAFQTKEDPFRAGGPILAIAAVFLQDPSAAQACGDKFLLVGRGVAFHRAYAAVYPASIVIVTLSRRVTPQKRFGIPGFRPISSALDIASCSARTTRR